MVAVSFSCSYSSSLHSTRYCTLLYQPCEVQGMAVDNFRLCLAYWHHWIPLFRWIILACHRTGRLGPELPPKLAEWYLKRECCCDVYEWVLSELTHEVFNKAGHWVNPFHPVSLPHLHFYRHILAASCRLLSSAQSRLCPLRCCTCSLKWALPFLCPDLKEGILCNATYFLIRFKLHNSLVLNI